MLFREMHIEDVPILVISLDRRPDRWAAFQQRAQAANMKNVQRLSAVDAKTFDAQNYPGISLLTAHNIKNKTRRAHHEIDRPGAVGCSLSHFKAWEHLQNSSAPAIIVFEDDSMVPLDFNRRLRKALAELPSEWDMVTFFNTQYAGGLSGCTPISTEQPWSSCTSLMGAHAYMLSRRGASRLLSRAFPIEMHVDAYMAFMARLNHIKMIWTPDMQFEQVLEDSDINHGDTGILNIPTNMEKHGIVALDMTSLIGVMTMAAVVGGLVSLAYVVRKR